MSGKLTLAQRALARVDQIYPALKPGTPHYLTRTKQRVAWRLGYIRGYEEARREIIARHLESIDEHAKAKE